MMNKNKNKSKKNTLIINKKLFFASNKEGLQNKGFISPLSNTLEKNKKNVIDILEEYDFPEDVIVVEVEIKKIYKVDKTLVEVKL